MLLKRISIRNFRAIRQAEIEVGAQLALIGGNGTGKSTVLRALDKFYGPSASMEMDDFFARRPAETVISLTFTAFSAEERGRFGSRIHNDEMTVARVFDPELGRASGSYFGVTSQHQEFARIRSLATGEKRPAYTQLREAGGIYADLPPPARAAADIEAQMSEWEARHSEHCQLLRDDGRFFGFTNVANGALQRSTAFVFIPAVRDVSADAQDSKGAVVARLLELVVKNVVQQRQDFREWKNRVSEEYKAITNPDALPELGNLGDDLTSTLQAYYRESAVELNWRPAEEFAVPLPAADVQLGEGGFVGPVNRKGHGLQRALILTLLQHLARAVATATPAENGNDAIGGGEALPGLILAIEEPELYQHPQKQRHFARVLSELSSGKLPGVAACTQVLFASHSPLFVAMDRFDEIRLARRINHEGANCKECAFTESSLATVTERLRAAYPERAQQLTPEGLRARLHIIGPELAEGFFAEAVVLVEGLGDKAAITAAASLRGVDLLARGIAVVAADGKSNMDRPYLIFREFGIPVYAIWDCDREEKEINKALQRVCGVPEDQLSPARTIVARAYASFEDRLETTLKAEIGEHQFHSTCEAIRAEYGIPETRDLLKSAFAVRELLMRAAAEECRSQTLDSIVTEIIRISPELA